MRDESDAVRDHCQREHRQRLEPGCAPAAAGGQCHQRGADDTDAGTEGCAAHEVDEGLAGSAGADGLGGQGTGQEQVDEWGDDPVVQTTFDVQDPPHPCGDACVRENRGPEGGIGRCDDGTDHGGDPDSTRREQEGRQRRPESDRERESDPEKTSRDPGVGRESPGIDPRRVGEEHEAQCDLRQRTDGRRVQLKMDECDGPVGNPQPEQHEGDRRGDLPPLEAVRNQAPHDHTRGDDGESGGIESMIHFDALRSPLRLTRWCFH